MNKKIRLIALIIVVLMAISLLFSSLYPVFASSASLQEQIEELTQQIKEGRDKINSQKKLRELYSTELSRLDGEMEEISSSIIDYTAQKEETEILLAAAQTEYEEALAKRAEYQKLLNERLAVMYMYGSSGYLEILFGSHSLAELVGRVSAISAIITYDNDIAEKLAELEAQIEAKRDEIAEKKAQLEQILANLEAENERLEALHSEKQAMYDEARDNQVYWESVVEDLEADSAELYRQIASELNGESDYGNSYMGFLWPTPGYDYITDYYGGRTHPLTGTYKMHYGVDIGAPMGAKIVAPANGKVAYAQYHNSFGKCIILDLGTDDDGDSWQMLFAHSSKLLVSVGDFVTKGQTIAYIGSTGDSTGPHLHFEVRINGSRVNPLNYY